MDSTSIGPAYDYCLNIARNHYENFPVASLLLPIRLRRPIAAIYTFARTADDYADEGDLTEIDRLRLLDKLSAKLVAVEQGSQTDDPLIIALADTIERFELPLQLFHDLLSAFRQDVTKRRYDNFSEIQDYCRRSANPVGRLLLYLNGDASEENLTLSDNICTALQLINFLQDIVQDYDENDRIYLPQDEMKKYNIDESWLRNRTVNMALQKLIWNQIERAYEIMLDGAPLGSNLSGRFGFEIRLIIQGGLRIVEKLLANIDNPYSRPRLSRADFPFILYRAIFDSHPIALSPLKKTP